MSDHFSGPRAMAGPAGDITDVYAFPSPERPGHLVMVINVGPLTQPGAHFSEAIGIRFRVRPVAIAGVGADAAFRFGPETEELLFECEFAAPQSNGSGPALVQEGWCNTPSGERVHFVVHDEQGGRADGVRIFAGMRSDPFFMDVNATNQSAASGRLEFAEVGNNLALGQNVLSVVIEADCRPWLRKGHGPLFGAVGETVVAGRLPIRIERFGRPEIKNVLLGMKQHDQINRDLEVRDLYNLEDAFHMSADYRGVYRARMDANLPVYDRLDGKTDWELGPDGRHPLTELLLADYVVVDVTKPYAEDTFLEIERALLEGRAHQSCGGRTPNDDAMDTLLTLIIAGLNGPPVGDGVDEPTNPATTTFPYLAAPNPDPPAIIPPAPPSESVA